MTLLTAEDAPRVARLARLALAPDELARLAPALEAITRDFSTLAARADQLPEAPPAAPGALREDDVAPAPPDVVEGILRAAAPRVDPTTRSVISSRTSGAP